MNTVDNLTYYVFKDSIVLNYKNKEISSTEVIAKDDPRFEKVLSLIKQGEMGEIPDLIQRSYIKTLLSLK